MRFLDKFDKKKLFKSRLSLLLGIFVIGIIVSMILFKTFTNKEKPVVEPVKIKLAREAVSTDDLWRHTMQEKMLEQENILNKEIDAIKKEGESNAKV